MGKEMMQMMYGNSSMGFSYSPDRRNDKVNHYNNNSQFLNANGNRQGGYYSASTGYNKSATRGWYDGAGRYHEN